MTEHETAQKLSLAYIRGLVVSQNGKCSITGLPLDPTEANADHIIPLSRKELNPPKGRQNIWLVHKTVNAMKGALTYDEFVEFARLVVKHEVQTRINLENITKNNIKSIPKKEFDKWVEENCDEKGVVLS